MQTGPCPCPGAGGHSLRQTLPGPLVFLNKQHRAEAVLACKPVKWGGVSGVMCSACQGSRGCCFLKATTSPGTACSHCLYHCTREQWVPPSFFSSPAWHLHIGSLHPIPGPAQLISSVKCSGRPREASGAWDGYTGTGQVKRNKRGLVQEESTRVVVGVGWAWLSFPQTRGCRRGKDVPGRSGDSGRCCQAPPGTRRP